jgi:hypothetical protein
VEGAATFMVGIVDPGNINAMNMIHTQRFTRDRLRNSSR